MRGNRPREKGGHGGPPLRAWAQFREIQPGKLAEQLERLAVPGLGRLDLVVEEAYKDPFSFMRDSRSPPAVMGRDANESGFAARAGPAVSQPIECV